MKSMFMNCDSLKEINLFKFNTENVNNMSYMFYNCKSLKNLYISNFNTSK
jgi:surface protein